METRVIPVYRMAGMGLYKLVGLEEDHPEKVVCLGYLRNTEILQESEGFAYPRVLT